MANLMSFLPTRAGEGSDVKPTHDQLVSRVNVLSTRVSVLERELAGLKASIASLTAGQSAPAPARTLDSASSARKIMQYIGQEVYGKTDDTANLPVRAELLSNPVFRPIREKLAAEGKLITAEIPLLRALANRAPDGRLIFAVKVGR